MFMHTMSPSSMNGWILSTTCKHHIPKVMTLAVWRMLNMRDTLFSFFNQKFRWGECPVQTLVSLLILVKCLPNVVYRIPCKAGAKYTPNTVCKAKSTYESQDVVLHKDYEYSCWVHGCLSSKTTKKKTQYLSLEKSCKVIPWADDIGIFKTCPLLHTLQSLANSLHKYTKKRNSQNTSFFSRLNLQHLKICVCIKHKAPTYSHFQKEQAYTHDWCQFPLVYELPV